MSLLCACSAAALMAFAASAASPEPAPAKSRALQLALSQAYDFNDSSPAPLHGATSEFSAGALSFGVRRPVRQAWGPPMSGRDLESDGLDLEFSVSAKGPADLGVAIARRTRNEEWAGGSVRSEGGELSLGQRLSIEELATPTWDAPTWYLFAAADGEALTWAPGVGPAREGGLRLQEERVMVGDVQAGLSMEASNLQASLSFIQREVSNGQRSEDQNYTGLSVTWRR